MPAGELVQRFVAEAEEALARCRPRRAVEHAPRRRRRGRRGHDRGRAGAPSPLGRRARDRVLRAGRFTSYSACGIPYLVGDVVHDADALVARTPEEHRRAGSRCAWNKRCRSSISTRARSPLVRSTDGVETTEAFDQLVLATGADAAATFDPRHRRRAASTACRRSRTGSRSALRSTTPRIARAVVVGAGYIGLELAEALVLRGMSVSVVGVGDRSRCRRSTPTWARSSRTLLREVGVDLYLEERVEGFDVDDGAVRAVARRRVVCSRPTSSCSASACSRRRSSPMLQGSTWATPAGSSSTTTSAPRRKVSSPRATASRRSTACHAAARRHRARHARQQAGSSGRHQQHAAATSRFPAWSAPRCTKICKYEVARTGLTEHGGRRCGVRRHGGHHGVDDPGGLLPGRAPDHGQARGGAAPGAGCSEVQIVGEEGAAKRIDVVAMAVWNGDYRRASCSTSTWDTRRRSHPLWDPVLVAAVAPSPSGRRVQRRGVGGLFGEVGSYIIATSSSKSTLRLPAELSVRLRRRRP